MSDPNALVGRASGGAIQVGCAARASFVRQMPPPAAATQSRQGAPEGADDLPQLGSTASAVTRPDSCVGGPDCVAGSKNCEASPETLGVTGPRACQAPGAAAAAAWNVAADPNAPGAAWCGFASNDFRPLFARLSST